MTETQEMNPFIDHPATPKRRGTGWEFKFANGRGASVINDGYGREEGLWELAVLDSDGHLDYSTPITSDVEGWLSVDDVRALLRRIAELPQR